MKKRHIIMISIVGFFALIMLMLLSEKNTKYLTCTYKGDFQGLDSLSTLDIAVRKNKVKNMNMTINVIIPENSEIQKDDLIAYINYQGKMKAKSTSDGVKLTANMHSGYFDTLGLSSYSSYSELKELLEIEGYTCK